MVNRHLREAEAEGLTTTEEQIQYLDDAHTNLCKELQMWLDEDEQEHVYSVLQDLDAVLDALHTVTEQEGY